MHGFLNDIVDYVVNGHCTGSFKFALMSGDLYGAVEKADDNNILILVQLVKWVYNHCPSGSYGTIAKVREWSKKGGLMGLGGQSSVDQWKAIHNLEI